MSVTLNPVPGPGFKPTSDMVNSEDPEVRASQVANLREILLWAESILDQIVSVGEVISLGNTVEEERTYGLSSDEGSSPFASRADHTHGTPGLSSTTPQVVSFTSSSAGSGPAPSRDDHTHLIQEDCFITFTATGNPLVWTMPRAYIQNSLIIFVGPVPMIPGEDFTTSGTTFTVDAAWTGVTFSMPPATLPDQNLIVFRGRY